MQGSSHGVWFEFCRIDPKTGDYPAAPSWRIFGSDARWLLIATREKGFLDGSDTSQDWTPMSEEIADKDTMISKGWCQTADTIEAMCELILEDPENEGKMVLENLKASLENYNRYVVEGADSDFNRPAASLAPINPPYFWHKNYPVEIETDLTINVRCPEGCDQSGGTIAIQDENDVFVAEQELSFFDEEQGIATTGSFPVQIPTDPGEYTWIITFFPSENSSEALKAWAACEIESVDETILAADEDEKTENEAICAAHAIVQASFSFKANMHITGMRVHRDYAPVEIGQDYTITVGIECLTGCSLAGQNINVFCEGELLATAEAEGSVGEKGRPYQAIITLTAPEEVCLFELICVVAPEGLGLAHTSNTCKHYVTTKLPNQCCLDIRVVNSESLEPLANVDLTMKPVDGYPSWWRSDSEGKVSIGAPYGEVKVTATLEDYEYAEENIKLVAGEEVVELTLPLESHFPVIS